jgi:hypothetical protein
MAVPWWWRPRRLPKHRFLRPSGACEDFNELFLLLSLWLLLLLAYYSPGEGRTWPPSTWSQVHVRGKTQSGGWAKGAGTSGAAGTRGGSWLQGKLLVCRGFPLTCLHLTSIQSYDRHLLKITLSQNFTSVWRRMLKKFETTLWHHRHSGITQMYYIFLSVTFTNIIPSVHKLSETDSYQNVVSLSCLLFRHF